MITIDPRSLAQIDGFQKALKAVEKIGEVVKAVDLHAKRRAEGGASNAQVFDGLAKQGRDFVTPRPEDAQKIAQAFVDVVIRDMQRVFNTIGKTNARGKVITADKVARKLSGKAYMAAGNVWLKEITRRIKEADWIGKGSKNLSPEYEAYKLEKYKKAYPIGIATGQLIENVNPKTKNLKLRK